jgi:hypothetical protein
MGGGGHNYGRKTLSKGSLGRFRHSLENHIKVDLKAVGRIVWTGLNWLKMWPNTKLVRFSYYCD